MYALTGDGEDALSYLDEQLSRTEILTGRNTRRVRFNACRTAGGEVLRIGDAGSGSVDDDAGEADTLTCVVVRGEGQRRTSGKRLRIRPCIVAKGLTVSSYDRGYLRISGFDIEVTILRTAIGTDIHFDRRETGKLYLRRSQLFAFIEEPIRAAHRSSVGPSLRMIRVVGIDHRGDDTSLFAMSKDSIEGHIR